MQKTNWVLGLAAVATVVSGSAAEAAVTGAGSSFVYPVLSRWAADFKKAGGEEINYQSVGSGAGIAQIKAATVDFGATDKPMTPDELQAAGLAQFPVVVGGIVPVINLSGLRPGRLHLTGPVLAGIFAGQVKKWNDPVIAKLNPGLKLPDMAISVVHRSDGSGTTYNFTHYLSQVSKGWKDRIGEGTTVTQAERNSGSGMRAMLEGPLHEAAVVYINGKRAGSVWSAPYEVPVGNLLKAGPNQIRIEVANLAINQMAKGPLPDLKPLIAKYGDRFQPQDLGNLKPLPSGLIAPVKLVAK